MGDSNSNQSNSNNQIARFTLLMDRSQSKPLIIVKGSGDSIKTYKGILQQYNLPKAANYRIVTTFSGDNYLYFFGERTTIMSFVIQFTDGTMFVRKKNESDYDSLYIHKIMDALFDGNGFATISFNRILVYANILDIETSGSSSTPGILGVQMTVAVKSYRIKDALSGDKK